MAATSVKAYAAYAAASLPSIVFFIIAIVINSFPDIQSLRFDSVLTGLKGFQIRFGLTC